MVCRPGSRLRTHSDFDFDRTSIFEFLGGECDYVIWDYARRDGELRNSIPRYHDDDLRNCTHGFGGEDYSERV